MVALLALSLPGALSLMSAAFWGRVSLRRGHAYLPPFPSWIFPPQLAYGGLSVLPERVTGPCSAPAISFSVSCYGAESNWSGPYF